MKKYKTEFTQEELKNALYANSDEASTLIEDVSKWNAFKTNFLKFLKKIKNVPVLGTKIDDITCLVELVESYIKKEYRDISKGTIVSFVAVLIYLLNPLDIVPDMTPILGYTDDAALLLLSLKVNHELNKYRAAVTIQKTSALEMLEALLANEIMSFIGDQFLAAAVWDQKKTIKLLVSDDQQVELPIECMIKEINVPFTQYVEYEIETEEDILASLSRIVMSNNIRWVQEAEQKVFLEPDFSDRWNNYIIQETE